MTKKAFWCIRVKPKDYRMEYVVPAKGSRKDVAIKKACITGLISEGDCDLIKDATQITKEQYNEMIGKSKKDKRAKMQEEIGDE